jgi:prolyl oligopeptidase
MATFVDFIDRNDKRPIAPRSSRVCAGLTGALLIMMSQGQSIANGAEKSTKMSYPVAPRGNVVDDYHGTKVADPFRPLEDPDSAVTRAWVEAQNKLTFGFLEKIPQRDSIRKRLTELWDYEKFGVPLKEGGRYFFSRNSGLQNQGVLYTTDSLEAEPRVLLDPNTLSSDGTVALAGLAVSDDGKYLAYGIAAAGSDWNTWKIRDVATGNDLPDELKWIKFSGVDWSPDNRGFFYGRYPEPKPGEDLKGVNYHQKVYYHRINTHQTDDTLVWEDPENKEWRATANVTDDGKYLIVTIGKGTDDKYRVLYRPFDQPKAPFRHLVGDFDADYTAIDNEGSTIWFKTNKDAPRGKVIGIDTDRPESAHWTELIPQADETLESVDVVGGHFIANYLKDAHTLMRVFDLKGKHVRDIELPGLGTAGGFAGKRRDAETFFNFNAFTAPSTIYRYEIATGKTTIWRRPKLTFDPSQYETTQAFFNSKDGTRIPIFLSHKRGLKRDGNNPTLLYGYGGFNVSLTPSFSPAALVWMEMGGIYAIPNLRGGGEYGESWHQAGTKLNKQNVFDDFIAAAEWLIAGKFTSPAKLAISGGSNGGLLVGACLTQRPELFGAALPAVGVMDMLRFHKFTIGWAWTDDYGSSEQPDQFRALYAYSPLHRIKPGTCYPPTLITTADHDDRVVPAHSFKFAAALQEAQSCDNPILIRIETKAGHGAGKPTAKIIEEAADRYAFLTRVLEMGPDAKNHHHED